MNIAKCPCQHCSARIEFDPARANTYVACPQCGMETMLFVPVSPPAPKRIEIPQVQPSQPSAPSVELGYLLAVLLPFAGFFYGIYLMAKQQPGHGVTCIAISIAVPALLFALLN